MIVRLLWHNIRMMVRVVLPLYLLTLFPLSSHAQNFYNLTADEVRIDSLLPVLCSFTRAVCRLSLFRRYRLSRICGDDSFGIEAL